MRSSDSMNRALVGATLIMVSMIAVLAGCQIEPATSENDPVLAIRIADIDTGVAPADCADSYGSRITGYIANEDDSFTAVAFPADGFLMAAITEESGYCQSKFERVDATDEDGNAVTLGPGQFADMGFGYYEIEYLTPSGIELTMAGGVPAPTFVTLQNSDSSTIVELIAGTAGGSVDLTPLEDLLNDIWEEVHGANYGAICVEAFTSLANIPHAPLTGCEWKWDGGATAITGDEDPTGDCSGLFLADVIAEHHGIEANCGDFAASASVEVYPFNQVDVTEAWILVHDGVAEGEPCTQSQSYLFGLNLLSWNFGSELGEGGSGNDFGSCVQIDTTDVELELSDCDAAAPGILTVDGLVVTADSAALSALGDDSADAVECDIESSAGHTIPVRLTPVEVIQ